MKRHITKTVQFITLFVFVCCFLTNINAQNIAIEQDGACINCPDLTADPSAALEVRATDRGILIPRVDSTRVVSNPAEGLMVYDNSVNAFKAYDGINWSKMGGTDYISISYSNTFVGNYAGISDTTGSFNTAIGRDALSSNATGDFNTANGSFSLSYNTTGSYNTATGKDALRNNSDGYYNTSVGYCSYPQN